MVSDGSGSKGPLRSVVVGVDDSDGARVALRWADALVTERQANGIETRAVAVTAWRQPAYDFFGGLADIDAIEKASAQMLDGTLAELADPGRFEAIVRLGSPDEILIEEADRVDADLIVVGTRGRGALAELLVGSVSRSVAARADRPVAIVPATTTWAAGPVVVGFDGSPGGRAALAWAVDNNDGPIVAVSAWHLPTDAIYQPDTIDVDGFEAMVRSELEQAIDELSRSRPDLEVAERITPVVQRDDPRLSLVEASKNASHVVVGARAHRGVKGLLLGSTVDYVASRTHQTIIIVPPPEADLGGESQHG